VFCSKPTAGASKQIMPPFLSSPLLSSGGPASAMPAPCLAPKGRSADLQERINTSD
jgi:hypothetical protein